MSDLTPEQQALFKELSKKHAYDIAMLKKAKEDFNTEDLTEKEMLLSLLIVEMQNTLVASIHTALDDYEDIMGINTMYYVLGASGLQFLYASLQELDAQEEHEMKEDLLNEMSFVMMDIDGDFDDMTDEFNVELDPSLIPQMPQEVETPKKIHKASKVKPKLSIVKGDKND